MDVAYSLSAEIEDGPTILFSDTLDTATATGYIDVTVDAGDTVVVEVHPGDASDLIALAMWSNYYDSLTYEIDSSGSPITWDGPLFLVGSGVIRGLVGTFNEIEVVNGSATYDSRIRIFTARVAEE